jgi:hypothetical protein
MGASELLHELARAGLTVTADGDRLMIRPANKLTDDMRGALCAAKPELLMLLTRRYRLARDEADRCHARGWNDAEIAAFTTRVTLFMRRGVSATDADDLAERLVLRDRDGDDRRMCIECCHCWLGRCGNHRRARLHSADVGRDMVVMLQRCPGFQPERAQTATAIHPPESDSDVSAAGPLGRAGASGVPLDGGWNSVGAAPSSAALGRAGVPASAG